MSIAKEDLLDRVRPTILIVDDEPAICRAVKTFLSIEGFEVQSAYTVAEARMRYRATKDRLHAILMDFLLLGENTGELSLEISKEFKGPIIAMSGSHLNDQVLRFGCTVSIGKPFSPKELLDAVGEP